MAVRITLANGGLTVFTYASTAAVRGDSLGVYKWNQEESKVELLVTFRLDEFVTAAIVRGDVVTAVIQGKATAETAGEPAATE